MKTLSEVLKSTTSITEVAKTLECSRPTLYRYIELYEDGKVDQIPSEIKLYFDAIMTKGVSRVESEVYLRNLMKKRETLQHMLKETDCQIVELKRRYSSLVAVLEKDPDNEKLKKEHNMLTKQLQDMENMLCKYQEESKDLETELNMTAASVEKAVKESRESGPDWVDAEIRHVCSGINGNFIIIYEKSDFDSEVYVELYARIAGNDEYIGIRHTSPKLSGAAGSRALRTSPAVHTPA